MPSNALFKSPSLENECFINQIKAKCNFHMETTNYLGDFISYINITNFCISTCNKDQELTVLVTNLILNPIVGLKNVLVVISTLEKDNYIIDSTSFYTEKIFPVKSNSINDISIKRTIALIDKETLIDVEITTSNIIPKSLKINNLL